MKRCTNRDFNVRIDTPLLRFLVVPYITDISGKQTVTEGDDVMLDCVATGNPTPNITWTKLPENVVVTMPLTRIRRQDTGEYRCTADNGIGSPAFGNVLIILDGEFFLL